jgi:hypothetical protein
MNKKMSGGKKMAIAGGMAAVAGGAYYLLGPKSKAHQKKAKALMGKVKKEAKKVDLKKVENELETLLKRAMKKPAKVSTKKRA